MVRRTVESMKYFEKNAERQGKVFEFKYKNETEQIKDEIIRKN
jgi:phosphoribosylformylglycinamidine (FGAM) synthase PurS component